MDTWPCPLGDSAASLNRSPSAVRTKPQKTRGALLANSKSMMVTHRCLLSPPCTNNRAPQVPTPTWRVLTPQESMLRPMGPTLQTLTGWHRTRAEAQLSKHLGPVLGAVHSSCLASSAPSSVVKLCNCDFAFFFLLTVLPETGSKTFSGSSQEEYCWVQGRHRVPQYLPPRIALGTLLSAGHQEEVGGRCSGQGTT